MYKGLFKVDIITKLMEIYSQACYRIGVRTPFHNINIG